MAKNPGMVMMITPSMMKTITIITKTLMDHDAMGRKIGFDLVMERFEAARSAAEERPKNLV